MNSFTTGAVSHGKANISIHTFSLVFQSERSSAEKRNTWTSHSVLPPIISPRPNEPSPHHANGRSSGYSSNAPSAKSQPLPTEPVQLDKLEEMELLKRIGMSLRYHSMDILKRIYNEVSSTHDQNLTGWAHFTDITFTLEKCQVGNEQFNLS